MSAIDDVHIEGPRNVQDALLWFYGELVGLQLCENDSPNRLLFKSDRLRLSIAMCTGPSIEGVAHRVHCLVASLEQIAEELEQRHHEFQWIRGLQFTDRAISLLDPAGNRVMLRPKYSAALF